MFQRRPRAQKKKKKKQTTMLATLLNLFQRARDFWSQASSLCEHSWKIKGFRMFKVTDLILFTSLMLAFRSGTNWCFGRSMPQKANLGIQCLSVSRGESTQSRGEPYHQFQASNLTRTNSAYGYNQETIGPSYRTIETSRHLELSAMFLAWVEHTCSQLSNCWV